jgi:hypothetical protein
LIEHLDKVIIYMVDYLATFLAFRDARIAVDDAGLEFGRMSAWGSIGGLG